MGEPPEMHGTTPRVRQAVTRLLVYDAGGDGADSGELAAASGRLLDRLSQRLSVVIGRGGVEALFLRAAKLTKAEFTLLDERMFSRDQGQSAGDALRARLQDQESHVTAEISVTLFATFVGMLTTILGERLAWSLLRDDWPETLRSETYFQETEE